MSSASRLHELLSHVERIGAIVEGDPAMVGVVGDALEWGRNRGQVDYLGTGSPLERIKAFERDIYLEHLRGRFDELRPGSRVLDAGCGCGRFAEHLARHPVHLTLLDAMPAAVEAARLAAEKSMHLDARADGLVGDVRCLDSISDGWFDAVLAIEIACYVGPPARAVRELARVTRPGGMIAISVEARYGSALYDPRLDIETALELLRTDRLHFACDVEVRYSTRESFRALLEESGLEVDWIVGCHYVADGPFDRLVDWTRDDADHLERLRDLEALCSSDPVLSELPRVWLALTRRG